MILAGDIGGTKTYLGLFDWIDERVEPVKFEQFLNVDFESFEEILEEFLISAQAQSDEAADENSDAEEHSKDCPPSTRKEVIQAACFGVAGPISENRCRATNIPWVIDGSSLITQLETPQVRLLNDVEAMAYGVLVLKPEETELINGENQGNGTKVLIAPGTGLGEGILFWDGEKHHALPSEGGHASFAPISDLGIELLRYLKTNFLHVSFERILSGEGLFAIYQFLRDTKKNEPTWFAERLPTGDSPTLIAEAGLNGKPEICVQALDLFISILGTEAGNLALTTLSRGGVYLGGGIVPQILPKLRDERFTQAFVSKGRHKRFLNSIPVYVILNDKTALLGAASVAAQMTCSFQST